jgi:uncharacterized protein involved in tellurium resistance
VRPVHRARTGSRTILTPHEPSVTLSRVQSGIGTLTFEAVCSPEVGDLRLGCAYQLADGHSSTVNHAAGRRFGPRDSRRPVVVGQREQYERISVDLRQCRSLQRLVVFGFSESGRPLSWGGTLVVATHAGARVELPIEMRPSGGVLVLMSLYNVRGEFVLRAEMDVIDGPVRQACRAYGFDRISWLDDHTPVE